MLILDEATSALDAESEYLVSGGSRCRGRGGGCGGEVGGGMGREAGGGGAMAGTQAEQWPQVLSGHGRETGSSRQGHPAPSRATAE